MSNLNMKRSQTKLPRNDEVAQTKEWTFFTNHAHVLICLSSNPKAILREIALAVGITERGVQKIITDLETAGFLDRKRVGRRNTYRLNLTRSLRHPVEQHKTIGDIIKALFPLGDSTRVGSRRQKDSPS